MVISKNVLTTYTDTTESVNSVRNVELDRESS